MPYDDDSIDEDWSDDESADDSDDTLPCPSCGTEIYADLDHCPQCGHWLTDDDRRTLDRDRGLFSARRVRLIALALLIIFVLGLLIELFLLG